VTTLPPGGVLYDIAESVIKQRMGVTKEDINCDAIFREVNRIMVNSGFEAAHLDGKVHIRMSDLPRSWNGITNHTQLVLYTDIERARLRQSGSLLIPTSPNSDGSTPPGHEDVGPPGASPQPNASTV
jgi:hypothetical protein